MTATESRRLEIRIVSAKNLPDIRLLGLMKVYAEVSINGHYGSMHRTSTDRDGDTNPTWNFGVVYHIGETYLRRSGKDVVVKLFCERSFGDKFIGHVIIPINTLFDNGLKSGNDLSFPIDGTAYGRLYIRYCFEEKKALVAPPPPPPPPRRPKPLPSRRREEETTFFASQTTRFWDI